MEENGKDMQEQSVENSTEQMQTDGNATQQTGYSNAQQNGYNQQNVVYDDQWVKPGDQGLAIAGLVLGVLSLVCCCFGMGFPFAIGSLIVSIISLNQGKPGRGMAIAGIVCSVISLLLSFVMVIASVVGVFAFENNAYSTIFDNYYSSYYDW